MKKRTHAQKCALLHTMELYVYLRDVEQTADEARRAYNYDSPEHTALSDLASSLAAQVYAFLLPMSGFDHKLRTDTDHELYSDAPNFKKLLHWKEGEP